MKAPSNQHEALAILARPEFGNPLHIEAVHLLEAYEEAVELGADGAEITATCPHCDGSGEVEVVVQLHRLDLTELRKVVAACKENA